MEPVLTKFVKFSLKTRSLLELVMRHPTGSIELTFVLSYTVPEPRITVGGEGRVGIVISYLLANPDVPVWFEKTVIATKLPIRITFTVNVINVNVLAFKSVIEETVRL